MSVASVPHLDSNSEVFLGRFARGHLHNSKVDWEMTKIFLDLTSWALDGDLSGLASDLDCKKS